MDNDPVAGIAGDCVGGKMSALDELTQILDLLDKAIDLLIRLQNVPENHGNYTIKAQEQMRWAIRRLSQRVWLLSSQLTPNGQTA